MLKNPKYVYGPVDGFVSASLNFGEFILGKLLEHSGKIALINCTTHEQVTYDEVAQEAMNIAVSLTRMGVRKGDVVAISSENRKELMISTVGIICTGAIATTINMGYINDELNHVLDIAKPKYLFLSPLAYKMHAHIYRSLPYVREIIIFGTDRIANTISYSDIAVANKDDLSNTNTSVYKITDNIKSEDFVPADVEGQIDTVFILYSSGTTGLPKGVMLTHLNLLSLFASPNPLPPRKFLSITPWYHIIGLIGTLTQFVKGSTTVYLPKFDANFFLKTVEKYRIEQITLVPTALIALCKCDLQCDTSSLIIIRSGGAPLDEASAKAVKNRFPNAEPVLQGYGMTETTFTVALNNNEDKLASIGFPASHTVFKVVDPETREVLGPKKAGEICVKSLMVMKGYVGKDRKDDFDDEGFFRTGDIGYYDEDGYFYIVDRLKELIKFKAFQVPPAEIESVLLKHPGIKDVGVVGIPHPTAGEVPIAFVVLKAEGSLTEKEIQEFVAKRLSNPKHLRGGVRFINEIPKTQSGKILRRELRKMAKSVTSKL